jgi:peptide deformylase
LSKILNTSSFLTDKTEIFINMLTLGVAMSSILGQMKFVDDQDPILDSLARELSVEEIQAPAMQCFFHEIIRFAKGEQSDQQKHLLVGLAAPQIGFDIRVILVDVEADGKGGFARLQLYINPEIVEFSSDTNRWYEGCFSTGNVKGIVDRPSKITVKALDRTGHEVNETHSGYVARIFQHEIDHLNGVRFPDRVPHHDSLHIVKAEEMYTYRNQEAWRNWKRTIPQKDWKNHMQ